MPNSTTSGPPKAYHGVGLVTLRYVKGDSKGWYPMILCRVTLGRIYYCANQDPTKDPGRDKLESACTTGGYHCVLGDRLKARGTYREYVVYDHFQVYPQFIVWYSRT
ncbi:hypothetical protein AK812_SmicGene3389 [Symbiodinium microadriaticum]|uniref:PARP catalytic domain-containing protein n=1 Tax=Symbiodinium microadriaticum TaxID=2951 RepID=A0A1Q9EZ84_SYMMI|nr:hypothetical protein AK812_SmicGene3389 [Symbiodinium microadriaticum]